MTLPRRPTASQRGKTIGRFRCGEDTQLRISTLCTSAHQSCSWQSSAPCAGEKTNKQKGAGLPDCTLSRLLGKSTKTVVPCRQKVASLLSGCAILTGSSPLPSSALQHAGSSGDVRQSRPCRQSTLSFSTMCRQTEVLNEPWPRKTRPPTKGRATLCHKLGDGSRQHVRHEGRNEGELPIISDRLEETSHQRLKKQKKPTKVPLSIALQE